MYDVEKETLEEFGITLDEFNKRYQEQIAELEKLCDLRMKSKFDGWVPEASTQGIYDAYGDLIASRQWK